MSLDSRDTLAVLQHPITLVFKAHCIKVGNFSFLHHCEDTSNAYGVRGPGLSKQKLKVLWKDLIFYSFSDWHILGKN